MSSIRRRLRTELLLVGAVMTVLGSVSVGWLVGREVDDLLDYQLEQVARSLVANDLTLRPNDRPEDAARHLVIRIVAPDDRLVYTSDDDVDVDVNAPLGFSNQPDRAETYPEGVRLFTLKGNRNRIQVMQPLSLRAALRWDAALDALWPAMLSLGVLAVWVGVALRSGFQPLDELSSLLKSRQADSLEPVALAECPDELQPAVRALNGLLERLQDAMRGQQRFISDAAHELRTPMAALRLQTQALGLCRSAEERTAQQQRVLDGIDRCSHLISQLMALARQDEMPESPWSDVSLRAVASEVLINLSVMAGQRDVQLALAEGADAVVRGVAPDLARLLSNLVDNAIKYAPAGTTVDVSVVGQPDESVWVVEDRGPGMPLAQRQRAFDRFYRGEHDQPGAGLGLAIVTQIARRHGAHVRLDARHDGPGLRATVHFPKSGE